MFVLTIWSKVIRKVVGLLIKIQVQTQSFYHRATRSKPVCIVNNYTEYRPGSYIMVMDFHPVDGLSRGQFSKTLSLCSTSTEHVQEIGPRQSRTLYVWSYHFPVETAIVWKLKPRG